MYNMYMEPKISIQLARFILFLHRLKKITFIWEISLDLAAMG